MPEELLSQEVVDALLAAAVPAAPIAPAAHAAAVARNTGTRAAEAPRPRGPDRSAPSGSRPGSASGSGNALEVMVRGLDVGLDVVLGEVEMPIREILRLGSGSIVVTDRTLGTPVELRLSGRTVAIGDIVVVEEGYALRITRNLLRSAC